MDRSRISKTLSQDILAELRLSILNGQLQPGTRLKMADLTASLSVSLSVIREALNRLVEQGLVLLEPQVGFRVVTLSAADLVDLTEARVQVEGAACELSVRFGDHHWEADLVAAHHVLTRTPPMVEHGEHDILSNAWIDAHRTFHGVLLDGGQSTRLRAVAASLRDSAEIYRHWSAPVGLERHRDVAGEHLAILDTALARDADLTRDLLCRHIERTTQLLLSARNASGERTVEQVAAAVSAGT